MPRTKDILELPQLMGRKEKVKIIFSRTSFEERFGQLRGSPRW
jgi:hypothetical protein